MSIEVLLAALSPAGVEVGVDLRHRGGVVDGGGWVVGIVVVAVIFLEDASAAGFSTWEIRALACAAETLPTGLAGGLGLGLVSRAELRARPRMWICKSATRARAGERQVETIDCAWTIRYLDGPHPRDIMTALGQYPYHRSSHSGHNALETVLDQSSSAVCEDRRACPLANSCSTSDRRNGSWIWPVQQLLRSGREPGKPTATILLPGRIHFRLTTHDRVIQCALLPELRQQRIQHSATWNQRKRTRKSTVCKSVG